MNLDTGTLVTCVAALDKRAKECQRQGKSARVWLTAKRRVKTALLQRAADEIHAETPALLRRQAG